MHQEGLKVSSIKYIKQISNKIKTLFSVANQIERTRLGILDDDDSIDKL
jgi:hypothetical protein